MRSGRTGPSLRAGRSTPAAGCWPRPRSGTWTGTARARWWRPPAMATSTSGRPEPVPGRPPTGRASATTPGIRVVSGAESLATVSAMSIIDRALRVGEGKKFKEFEKNVARINDFEPELELESDEELRDRYEQLRERHLTGE